MSDLELANKARVDRAAQHNRDRIRSIAVSLAASGEVDEAQVFTNPDCEVFTAPDGAIMAQVWIGLPRKYWRKEEE